MPVDAVFILLEGKLAVWFRSHRGPERELARLNAGDRGRDVLRVRPPSVGHSQGFEGVNHLRSVSKAVINRKLVADAGFAARFYRALASYLSTTLRERHRDLGPGRKDEEEEEDADEIDPNVLDGVYLAGNGSTGW